jgi:hypothetical protein
MNVERTRSPAIACKVVDGEPLGVCNFEVDVGGVIMGFSQVSGLGYEPELQQVTAVTLRRAAGRDLAVWAWARDPEPRTVTVTLLDARREPACVFILKQARPVKWTGPALDATSHDLAMEELELTADDLEVRPTRRATDD